MNRSTRRNAPSPARRCRATVLAALAGIVLLTTTGCDGFVRAMATYGVTEIGYRALDSIVDRVSDGIDDSIDSIGS